MVSFRLCSIGMVFILFRTSSASRPTMSHRSTKHKHGSFGPVLLLKIQSFATFLSLSRAYLPSLFSSYLNSKSTRAVLMASSIIARYRLAYGMQ